jgi:hypothetical protein
MNLANLAAEINSIDNTEDMNTAIEIMKTRQKQIRKISQNRVKNLVSEGSRVTIRDHDNLGTVTITAVRRTKCSIETDDGFFFEVPITMVEV